MASYLDNDIKYLPGVGGQRASLLAAEAGIRTLGDLLHYYPFRYIDRTKIWRIAEVTEEVESYIQLRARILAVNHLGPARRQRLSVTVTDGSASTELVWFRGVKWIEKKLEIGREYLIFGRPNFFRGAFNMVHPEVESVTAALNRPNGSLQGVYSTTEKLANIQLGTRGIYNLVCNAWKLCEERIEETLPDEIRHAYGLIPLRDALFEIHFPQSHEQLRAAQYRLKFEELFGIQLHILSRRSIRLERANGFLFPKVSELFNAFYHEKLPFPLTGAQKRVIREIRNDTVSGHQMNRLLQGDVGSGKTLVALVSMLLAADNHYQSCLMAPTEILARQHFASISRMVEGLPIRIGILTGASKTKERNEVLKGAASGEIQILIGTHALLEERVQFADLGLVVIDEQHRFGVEQRARLWTKNRQTPHILVMTATPIPRTLAMTLYGDLEVSVIDELPPGRKPIKTVHMTDAQRLALFGFMKREIAKGRQIYVVYPLIQESEKMDYKDLTDGYESISREFPPPHYLTTVVHGRMKPEEKQAGMRLFTEGQAQIMVATSVIEVGVDVPNATVMVIESAEKFGLSQLHQLRGRVGRGGEQSYCILMSGDKLSKEARTRLRAMVETTDGFELAELDMRLRGTGDLAGTQQSGMAFDLKIANLSQDNQLVELTRRAAEKCLQNDPELIDPRNALLKTLRDRYSTSAGRDYSMIS